MSKKERLPLSRFRIAERRTPRHLQWLLVFFIILVFHHANNCQVKVSEQDLNETINFYKTLNQNDAVKIFQSKMPKPVTDEKIRKGILDNLPPEILKLKIENSEITGKLKKLFEPVLKFYGRESVYEIIVFKHPTPIMFSDTGVVIVVSTGMVERTTSDSELVGDVAHEIGHEFFSRYSIYSRHLLKLVAENGQEPALNRKYSEAMALIELQCDAFAALTLSALQYNSLAFIEGLERTGKDFPSHGFDFHPPDEQRRRLVEQIASEENLALKPQTSSELKELKELIFALEK